MLTYLVRTNANERKTYVLSLDGDKKEKLAVLYSDFLIKPETKKDLTLTVYPKLGGGWEF